MRRNLRERIVLCKLGECFEMGGDQMWSMSKVLAGFAENASLVVESAVLG